jgi:WD40 repeat protein
MVPALGVRPTVPGYELLDILGRGAMGVVYRARQLKADRLVALKMVLAGSHADPDQLRRFRTEAEAAARLQHPNIVQVFEVGEHSDPGSGAVLPFFSQEFCAGGSLAERLRQGTLKPVEAARLIATLARAMHAAHRAGVVHRDLKPSNILFAGGGPEAELATLTPKVADFGLARKLDGAAQTQTGAILGTPSYMAPEQAGGQTQEHGPGVDIYALGAILYECLTGRPPFKAASAMDTILQVVRDETVHPRQLNPNVPRDLETICLKCLAKDPARRYTSAGALADDLERFLQGQPIQARPVGALERGWRWVRRNPVVAGLLAALVSVVITGLIAVSWALVKAEARGRELAKANISLTAAEAEASRRAEEAEEGGYLSDVALAHRLWRANDLSGMRTILDHCPPARRRWEWHYLDRIAHPERAVHPTDGVPAALAYSPDGKWLAFRTLTGTLTVLNVSTGKEQFQVPERQDKGMFVPLAFRPDSAELCFARTGGVRIVDPANGQAKEPDIALAQRCLALGYADGRWLAAVDPAKRNSLYEIRELTTGKILATLRIPPLAQQNVVQVVGGTFSPDGRRFALTLGDTGSRLGRGAEGPGGELFRPLVLVWDVASGKLLRQVEGGGSRLSSIAFAGDGLSVGFGRRGQAGEALVEGDTPPTALTGHVGNVLAVAFDNNGLFWSGGEDGLVIGHDRATGAERFVLRGCQNTVTRLAVSPDGREVATAVGSFSGGATAVYRHDLNGPAAETWRAPAAAGQVSLVTALSADGARAAAFSFPLGAPTTGRFTIRDVLRGTEKQLVPRGQWMHSAFRARGGLVVGEGKVVRVLGPDGVETSTVPLPTAANEVPLLTCTPDGKTLVMVGVGPAAAVRLTIRKIEGAHEGPEVLADLNEVLPRGARLLLVAPLDIVTDNEGRRAAAVVTLGWLSDDVARLRTRGVVLVWDVATGAEVFRQATDEPLHAVAFDPLAGADQSTTSRLVAAGGGPAGGRLYGWDLNSGERVLAWTGHARPILAVAFGPDGRVATGGGDRVVKVWDAATGREILTLDGFAREVTHLAFRPDGTLVAGTGIDWLSAQMVVGAPIDWPAAEVRIFRGTR